MTNSKKLPSMADRVARSLAQEARVANRMGDNALAQAAVEAFIAVRFPEPIKVPKALSWRSLLGVYAVAAIVPVAFLGSILFAGMAL